MTELVTTTWLANHLDDPNVRIVDTRWYVLDPNKGERDYHAGHIPNAVYLHVDRHLAAPPRPDAKTGRHPLPSAQAFAETMAQVGISNTTRVVVYDDAGGANAARVWWLLRYFTGGDVPPANASLLDGGWNLWVAEGRPISTETPTFARAVFNAHANPSLVADKAEVERLTHARNVLLLDARAPERYRGDTEPMDARAGHIPGARSAPLAGNLRGADDPRFKERSDLRARFDALGANGVDEIVAYCGSGINAAADLFALHLAGYDNTRLYAAAFSEWSRDPELPVITGDEPY